MPYSVYLIISKGSKRNKSYVGYTKNLKKRIALHNSNKGAKSTRGYYWEILYKKDFETRSEAMSFEYKLKKNKKQRKIILQTFNK